MKPDPEKPVTKESLAAFSVKFNVRQSTRNYKQFIESLRRRVGGTFSHGLPVLPDQNLTTQRFHIVLENNDNEMTLSIRRENLYLVGYKTKYSTSWLELGKDMIDPPSPHQILVSTFLDFSGHYQDLKRAVQVKSRNEIALRKESLIGAAYNLLNSIKLKAFMSGRTRNFFSGFISGNWMVDLEVCWGHISCDLLSLDMKHNHKFQVHFYHDKKISTAQEVTTILGVLLFKLDKFQSMVNAERTQKQPLAEVLVQINKSDMSGPLFLYSTVKVDNRLGSQIFTTEKRRNAMGKYFLRTTQARSIYASNGVLITIDLSYCTKSKGVYGGDGSVTIRYIVFSDAVEATVEVIVENGEHDVRLGESMRLSRSVIAIPLISSDPTLIVEAKLFHKNSGISKHEIAYGIAEFPCQHSGIVKKMISGKDGEIQVKVTWKRGENIQQGS
ncbi:60 kDa jasmonate-induced protein [Fagus crenata]